MTTVRRPAVGRSAAVVRPTPAALATLTPIGGEGVSVTGGFWGERLTTNHERTIPHGFEQLERAGNFSNLRLAAGAHGRYRAIGEDIGVIFPFLDTDVYKWLEAAGWELGRDPSATLARQCGRGDRARRSAPNGQTAISTATSRWSRRAASTGTSPGATSCTPSVTSSRPGSPGSARLATTGS